MSTEKKFKRIFDVEELPNQKQGGLKLRYKGEEYYFKKDQFAKKLGKWFRIYYCKHNRKYLCYASIRTTHEYDPTQGKVVTIFYHSSKQHDHISIRPPPKKRKKQTIVVPPPRPQLPEEEEEEEEEEEIVPHISSVINRKEEEKVIQIVLNITFFQYLSVYATPPRMILFDSDRGETRFQIEGRYVGCVGKDIHGRSSTLLSFAVPHNSCNRFRESVHVRVGLRRIDQIRFDSLNNDNLVICTKLDAFNNVLPEEVNRVSKKRKVQPVSRLGAITTITAVYFPLGPTSGNESVDIFFNISEPVFFSRFQNERLKKGALNCAFYMRKRDDTPNDTIDVSARAPSLGGVILVEDYLPRIGCFKNLGNEESFRNICRNSNFVIQAVTPRFSKPGKADVVISYMDNFYVSGREVYDYVGLTPPGPLSQPQISDGTQGSGCSDEGGDEGGGSGGSYNDDPDGIGFLFDSGWGGDDDNELTMLTEEDVDIFGANALSYACGKGDLEAVKILREKKGFDIGKKDIIGLTCFDVAAYFGYDDICVYLSTSIKKKEKNKKERETKRIVVQPSSSGSIRKKCSFCDKSNIVIDFKEGTLDHACFTGKPASKKILYNKKKVNKWGDLKFRHIKKNFAKCGFFSKGGDILAGKAVVCSGCNEEVVATKILLKKRYIAVFE